MKTLVALILVLAAFARNTDASAQIIIGPGHLEITQTITINNPTAVPIQFVRSSQLCVSSSPATFNAAANQSTSITVVWTFEDSGGDSCYTDHHNITYVDSNNGDNAFRIQQYGSSGNYACLDIEIFVVFFIDQAVCPEFSGDVIGPLNNNDGGVYCVPGTPSCPPSQSVAVDYYQNFGFLIANPQAPCIDQFCVVASAADDGGNNTLRAAISYARWNPGTQITFAPALAGQTITLSSEMPLIAGYNVDIDGGNNNITISGADKFRVFTIGDGGAFNIGQTTARISNLTIAHGNAQGGAGGWPGGGGGAGLGGAIFVTNTGLLRLTNVALTSNQASGGNGANSASCSGCAGGGGGGMGGRGGSVDQAAGGTGGGGGGGFGVAASGGDSSNASSGAGGYQGAFRSGFNQVFSTRAGNGGGIAGGSGGDSGGGGGGGVGIENVNFTTGTGGGGGGPGGGDGGVGGTFVGGNGGLGGGGGGGGTFVGGNGGVGAFADVEARGVAADPAGAGGFGGGGGGGLLGEFGNGGYAGGGGGGSFGTFGTGGFGAGAGGSVIGGGIGGGGGGAAMGGAIFVMDGGLLFVEGSTTVNGSNVTAGAGGGTGAGNGTAVGPGIFLAGSGALSFTPEAGQAQTMFDAIADQTGSGATGADAGSWGVIKSGAGTLVLAANNSYSGGTVVSNGALVLQGGTLGTANAPLTVSGGTLDLGGAALRTGPLTLATDTQSATEGKIQNGTLMSTSYAVRNLNSGLPAAIAASLVGGGALDKTGPGTVILTGNNTHSGGTTVSEGALEINGSLATSVNVARGATLQGNGRVGGAQIAAGGIFSPGWTSLDAAHRVMTVSGALTLQPDTTYRVQVSDAGSSMAKVDGSATLAGTVEVSFSPSSSFTLGRGLFTILHSAGRIGRFAKVVLRDPPAGYGAALRYTDTDVFLILACRACPRRD